MSFNIEKTPNHNAKLVILGLQPNLKKSICFLLPKLSQFPQEPISILHSKACHSTLKKPRTKM